MISMINRNKQIITTQLMIIFKHLLFLTTLLISIKLRFRMVNLKFYKRELKKNFKITINRN